MASAVGGRRLRATVLLALGWLLTAINIAAAAWAAYLPFLLKNMPEDPLFILRDATAFALMAVISLFGALVLGVLQIIFASRLAESLREDSDDTQAAEDALKLARTTAFLAVIFCLGSLAFDLKTYRQWADALNLII